MNFQMYKLVLEKAEEPEIKLPTSAGSSKKQESSRKTTWEAHIPHYLFILHTINSVLSYVQCVFRSTVSLFPSLETLPISPSFHIICLKFLFKPIYLFYISVLILYTWFPEKLHVVK